MRLKLIRPNCVVCRNHNLFGLFEIVNHDVLPELYPMLSNDCPTDRVTVSDIDHHFYG